MSEINHELGIIALESCRELGEQVNKIIQQKRNTEESLLIPTNEIRFSNGEGKVKLPETVRGKDIYILCDVGNYSCTYKMFGFTNHKGPDEHFQDIKRTVSAIRGKAARMVFEMDSPITKDIIDEIKKVEAVEKLVVINPVKEDI